MMILSTERVLELDKIWTPYVEKALFDEDNFKGYKIKDDAPKEVHDAYKEWEEIIDSRPKYPSLN